MSEQENELNKDNQALESGYIEKLPEELESLPPEIKREIKTFLSMSRLSTSSSSPILDKLINNTSQKYLRA